MNVTFSKIEKHHIFFKMRPQRINNETLRLRITKASQPFCFPLRYDVTPASLISDILSVFDFPPETDVLIKDENTGEVIFNLSHINRIDQKLNGSFLVSFQENDLKTKEFYDESNSKSQQNRQINHRDLLKEKILNLEPYQSIIFKHQFFVIVVNDILNKNITPITESLTQWVTLIDTQIVLSSMIEVASTQFSDRYFWTDFSGENGSQPQLAVDDPKLVLFSTIIVQLALYHTQYRKIIVPIIDPFRPSKLSELLLMSFFNVVFSRCPLEDAVSIFSSLFSDTWLFQSFVDYSSFGKFISQDPLPVVFPFLYIRSIILDMQNALITADEAIAIIEKIAVPDLILSSKLAKAIVKPIISSIFTEILRRENIKEDTIPETFFLHQIHDKASQVMIKFIKPYEHAQFTTIITMQKMFAKRNFYPPGLFHVIFGYLYNKKILSVPVINTWINDVSVRVPGKDSALIELNTFLITEIPNSLNKIIPLPQEPQKAQPQPQSQSK